MSQDYFDAEEFATVLHEQMEANTRMIEAIEDLDSSPEHYGDSSHGFHQGVINQIQKNNRAMKQLGQTVGFDVFDTENAVHD